MPISVPNQVRYFWYSAEFDRHIAIISAAGQMV